MFNERRLWGAAALVLLLSACATTTDSTSAAPSPSPDGITLTSGALASKGAAVRIKPRATYAGAKKARKVSLRVLPQIVQPGKKKAKAKKAKVGLVVQARPKRRTVVTLQVKAGKKWRTLRHASTDKKGHAVLGAPLRRAGKPATYRIKVGRATSPARSTKAWAKATHTENFNGRKLGKMWSHRMVGIYNPTGLRECSRAMPNATQVKGGQVRLSVRKDPARSGTCVAKRDGKSMGRYAWRTNGHISTEGKFDFRYGFAAARIKFPAEKGQHGAFWLQTSKRDFSAPFRSGNAGAEIDVIESFGKGSGPKSAKSLGLTSFTYHHARSDGSKPVKTGSWLKNTQQYMANRNAKPWNTYHVYSVEWTPQEYVFRIDGKVSWRSKVGISNQPQFLVLSLLSSDYEIPNLRGEHKLPVHMYVDWVRVWETGR